MTHVAVTEQRCPASGKQKLVRAVAVAKALRGAFGDAYACTDCGWWHLR